MFKTYFLYHQNAHFILEGVVTTFQVYIIIVFFMTTMVNMLTKSKFQKIKKICKPHALTIDQFLSLDFFRRDVDLNSESGTSSRIFYFCSVSVLDFALAFTLFLSSRALLSSALSKHFFYNLILFV